MAALETSEKMLETSCGSPHYASPEIVAGKNYHGAPSDIWSCGIILFALLTGHLPFDDDNIRKLLLKVQDGKFHMPANLSPLAKDLIWKMLRVDPASRITMAEILKHPLLHKYPAKRNNFKVPSPVSTDFVSRPVNSAEDVDIEILKNLQTLWHGASKESVIEKLLSKEANSEKTFYCLLMKYRHDHIDENEPSPNRKSSMQSLASGSRCRTPLNNTKNPAYLSRHRRTTSGTSKASRSRSRSRIRSRSRSRSRSHSQILYVRNKSRSSASRGSLSKSRSHSASSVRLRNRSVSSFRSGHGSRASSPPPPLPSEAVKMVEAELSNQSATAETHNSFEFASMLEQAFNFDSSASYNYHTSPLASETPEVYQTPSQFQDPPSPLLESPDILFASSPIEPSGNPGFLLPRIFEEDRFADAVEEELDLHMKRSLETNLFDPDYNRSKQSRKAFMETPTQNRSQSDRHSPFIFSKRTRNSPSSFDASSDLYKTLHLPETPSARKPASASKFDNSFRVTSNENSRLRISELLKTDSFQSQSPVGKSRSSTIQSSPPFAYNAKFTMTASLQMPSNRNKFDFAPNPSASNKVPNHRHSAPILEKPRVYAQPRLSDSPKTSADKRLSLNERMITSANNDKTVPKHTELSRNTSRSKSLLRKFALVPKRTAPPTPVEVEAKVKAIPVSKITPEGKNRVVSGASNADTVNSGSTWQSRQSRYSNAHSIAEDSEAGGIPAGVSFSKQNWFMKILNGRSETKGYYSPLSVAMLRRMIILILSEWQQYGISNISEDPTTSTIRAKVSSRNVLSLRSSKFRIEIESHTVRSSYYSFYRKPLYINGNKSEHVVTSIIIVRERGSSNTFLRFLGEMERALEERDALIKPKDDPLVTFEREQNPLGIYV